MTEIVRKPAPHAYEYETPDAGTYAETNHIDARYLLPPCDARRNASEDYGPNEAYSA